MPVSTSPKAPSASARAVLQRRLANIIASESPRGYWDNHTFNPNLHQIGQLLRLTDPTNTTGASVATAADMWVAEQLRQAGFSHVVPRLREPYYISPSVSSCYDNGYFDRIDENLERVQASIDRIKDIEAGLPADLNRTLAGERRALSRASSALTSAIRQARSRLEQSTIALVGEGRRKQIDVFIADWDRGLELAVSTKTLALGVESLNEQTKNLPNRWEEFDGDLKNLRAIFDVRERRRIGSGHPHLRAEFFQLGIERIASRRIEMSDDFVEQEHRRKP